MAAVALWLIPFSRLGLLATFAGVVFVGTWASDRAERFLGRKDPGLIVIDEVAGMMVSVALVPRTVPVLLCAFFLFRLFDIWKPLGAHQAQSLPGGWGVVADDAIAGATSLLALQALLLAQAKLGWAVL